MLLAELLLEVHGLPEAPMEASWARSRWDPGGVRGRSVFELVAILRRSERRHISRSRIHIKGAGCTLGCPAHRFAASEWPIVGLSGVAELTLIHLRTERTACAAAVPVT